MTTRSHGNGASFHALLALVAIAAFVWGLERWRRDAAHRAGSATRGRFVALGRCLLGRDAAALVRAPERARRRLRALAMATSTDAEPTWFDRCVPLARALSRHAIEVDDTGAPTAAQTRVGQSARRVAAAVDRVGLVWRVRSGDPETDMDVLAGALARFATEVDLADGEPSDANSAASPVAPAAPPEAAGVLLGTPGLEPTVVGTPARFFVGAPLPSVTEVVRGAGGFALETRANEPAVAWHLGGAGLARIDVRLDRSPDGLARLRVLRPGAPPALARVSPVDDPLQGLHVALAAVPAGARGDGALWLAQWTPWSGAVLARFAPRRPATALALAAPPPDALRRALDDAQGRGTAADEHVALAPLGDSVVVAYSRQRDPGAAVVQLALAAADSARTRVVPLDALEFAGTTPELEFCPAGPAGGAPTLLAATRREWRALAVDAAGARELARVAAPHAAAFDERLAVRCEPDGGVLAYAREHPRASPLLRCRPGADGGARACAALPPPRAPVPVALPLYTTRTPSGRALAHAEWPLVFAGADGAVLAARAAGAVVTVARLGAGERAWQAERVVFDAAAATHGVVVEGLGLYAAGRQAVLAVAAADGLHLFASDDAGASWR